MTDTQTDPNAPLPFDPATVGNDPIDAQEVPQEAPEQGGSYIPLLKFGTYCLQLPTDLDKCWGDPKPDKDGKPRLTLSFGNDHPLTVVGGPHDGDLVTGTISTRPRPRGRDKVPVADAFYFLRTSLQDQTPIQVLNDWKTAISRHAGQMFWAEIGGSANCNPKKTRYIDMENPEKPGTVVSMEDPAGTPGCGKGYYTRDITKQRDENGNLPDRIYCDQCGASLRVFNQIEKFLPPQRG